MRYLSRRGWRSTAWLLALSLLTGCAGFRGGWQSVAYVGDPAPVAAAEPSPPSASGPALAFPGVQLQVGLDNELQTYDLQVMLFVVPMSADPRSTYRRNLTPGKTRLFVTVTAQDDSFVFHPRAAVLTFGGRRFEGQAGYDFDRWTEAGVRDARSGQWDHRRVDQTLALEQAGRRYHLSIEFDTPVPSPELRDIEVDLSGALRSSRHPPLPVIRFVPGQWKEGYT